MELYSDTAMSNIKPLDAREQHFRIPAHAMACYGMSDRHEAPPYYPENKAVRQG